ncbi:MAG: TadE/TadG family type IV pilus assembly protein [Gaiellaceae bacterium]
MSRKAGVKAEGGQAMTEMAIVLPVLCLILFAIVQLGIVFNNYVTLTDAVRAGARKAAVSRQASDPVGLSVAQVRSSAADLQQGDLSVTVTSPWTPGSDVTVSASYPYSINLLGLVVRSGRISSATTERVE